MKCGWRREQRAVNVVRELEGSWFVEIRFTCEDEVNLCRNQVVKQLGVELSFKRCDNVPTLGFEGEVTKSCLNLSCAGGQMVNDGWQSTLCVQSLGLLKAEEGLTIVSVRVVDKPLGENRVGVELEVRPVSALGDDLADVLDANGGKTGSLHPPDDRPQVRHDDDLLFLVPNG